MPETFEKQIEKELKSMDQRLEELEGKVTSIDTKISQVVDAILGNALTKDGGVVNDIRSLQAKVKELEKKLIDQETFKNRIIWTISVLIAMGVLIQYIANIYISINKANVV
jgi:peptidoglycan hydrolase CwlO-like protein